MKDKIYFEMGEGERILSKLQNDIDYAATVLSEGICNEYETLTNKEVVDIQEEASDLLLKASYLIRKLLADCELEDEDNVVVHLRAANQWDLEEISKMESYRDIDITNKYDEKVGVHHIFCNDINLEGEEEFITKGLYIYYNGRIMTEGASHE